jgi:hypothetical protein
MTSRVANQPEAVTPTVTDALAESVDRLLAVTDEVQQRAIAAINAMSRIPKEPTMPSEGVTDEIKLRLREPDGTDYTRGFNNGLNAAITIVAVSHTVAPAEQSSDMVGRVARAIWLSECSGLWPYKNVGACVPAAKAALKASHHTELVEALLLAKIGGDQ